jgi:hypothetical protein
VEQERQCGASSLLASMAAAVAAANARAREQARRRGGDVPVRIWSGLRRRWSSGTSTSAEMERRWRETCEGRGSIAERERRD